MTFNTKEILERLRLRREAQAKLDKENAANVTPVSLGIQEPKTILASAAAIIAANALPVKEEEAQIFDRYGKPITLNANQKAFASLVIKGESCVMIGAAGTGKTTCTNAAVQGLIQTGKIPPIPSNHGHKHFIGGTPGIVICAYTRRATNNIRQNQSKDMQGNCITIHKLLCFEPVETTIEDSATGSSRKSRTFEPKYNKDNPLPDCIKAIVIEEGSMVSVDLWNQLIDAIQHEVQFIFLGDLNQLPPVFGLAILGFKLNQLPVVELTEVYRQALDSPIIALAHRILSGVPIELDELKEDWAKRENLTIVPWQKKISPENATTVLASFVLKSIASGAYDPETDGILIPFNKSCGTTELNKHIANALAKKEGKEVWEIIHKWQRSYYAIGDKCLYEKEDAIILDIYPNETYSGSIPYRTQSTTLDYWGNDSAESDEFEPDDVDDLLGSMGLGSGSDNEEGKIASSHVIKLHLMDSDRVITIESAGQVAALMLGYAITVHKSQGSEWEKVFLFFHESHATMIQRELLYTAVTRAKKQLIIVCAPNTFTNGVVNARIKGTTLAEKAEYFKGKQDQKDNDGRSDNM